MSTISIRHITPKHKYLKTVPMMLGFKCDAVNITEKHMHDSTEIWYALNGKARHTVGDEVFVQTAGTCVVVPAFVPHEIIISETEETPIFISINILDETLQSCGYEHFSYHDKSVVFEGKILPRFHKLSGKNRLQANEIIHKLSSEYSSLPDANFDTLINLYTNFLRLLGGEQSSFKPTKSILKRINSILDASDYVSDNLSEKITIKKLCEAAHMSQSRFCDYFTELTGMTPMNYVNNIKIVEARRLFLLRGKSPLEIVDLVGFSDRAHLCRQFKDFYGTTMSEYKKDHQVKQQLRDLSFRERWSDLQYLYEFFSDKSNGISDEK